VLDAAVDEVGMDGYGKRGHVASARFQAALSVKPIRGDRII